MCPTSSVPLELLKFRRRVKLVEDELRMRVGVVVPRPKTRDLVPPRHKQRVELQEVLGSDVNGVEGKSADI